MLEVSSMANERQLQTENTHFRWKLSKYDHPRKNKPKRSVLQLNFMCRG